MVYLVSLERDLDLRPINSFNGYVCSSSTHSFAPFDAALFANDNGDFFFSGLPHFPASPGSVIFNCVAPDVLQVLPVQFQRLVQAG